MTSSSERFPYVPRDPSLGTASLAPLLPFALTASASVAVSGLLDTGAAIAVLPYSLGIALGIDWDAQTIPVQLSGNLSALDARVIELSAVVGSYDDW